MCFLLQLFCQTRVFNRSLYESEDKPERRGVKEQKDSVQ